HDRVDVLGDGVGRAALHRRDDDLARAPLGLLLGLSLNLADAPVGVLANLVLDLLEEVLLGLAGGHAGDPLELLADLPARLAELDLQPVELLLALLQRLLLPLGLLHPTVELLLLLLETAL